MLEVRRLTHDRKLNNPQVEAAVSNSVAMRDKIVALNAVESAAQKAEKVNYNKSLSK